VRLVHHIKKEGSADWSHCDALGLLIALCASANAAKVHRSIQVWRRLICGDADIAARSLTPATGAPGYNRTFTAMIIVT
jgi:hypothetical protein